MTIQPRNKPNVTKTIQKNYYPHKVQNIRYKKPLNSTNLITQNN